jgi:4-hydroxybenzoate polyprenyltransferase
MSPICVDLDGTLVFTDTLHESFLLAIKKNPLSLFLIFFWLIKGKAYLKTKLSEYIELSVEDLPYNKKLIDWLMLKKDEGHKLVLATGANNIIAERIFKHLGFFDEWFASDHKVNLTSTNKSSCLSEVYGKKNYIYIGNDKSDIAVWKSAKSAGCVNTSNSVKKKAAKVADVELSLPKVRNYMFSILKACRVHQYVKNVLLFVPLMMSKLYTDINLVYVFFIAFFCFSFLASATYLINDLLDLQSDRNHSSKKNRPFASGELSISFGISLIMILFGFSYVLLLYLPLLFKLTLGVYLVTTLMYSFYLKRQPMLDVVVLSGLYTLRIFAGMTLISGGFSHWLLLFSIFIFTSLAFLKRFVELNKIDKVNRSGIQGRGYLSGEGGLLSTFGACSGCSAILVFALYIDSVRAQHLYTHPQLLYCACPVILYWVSYIWLQAFRGKVNDDPIVFAIKDRVSFLILGVVFFIYMISS